MAVITVRNLSKQYLLGSTVDHNTLRDAVAHRVSRLFGGKTTGPGEGREPRAIWALREVNFEVEKGEVVGIIGRNGAGKSTLLKVLSRITEPTDGEARLRGRVGSLLEVGTGFHPELTGRENIFLNGAIFGMRKREIEEKFEEIAAFAEVEKFLDTPVKRYSSGMYVRLAFAVAAHLEPEILIIDEVLAVGDAAFQKKCLGKMGEVAARGRTVLFVSHNMAAVRQLCDRALLVDLGRVTFDGDADRAIDKYLDFNGAREPVVSGQALRKASNVFNPGGVEYFRCAEIALLDSRQQPQGQFKSDEEITVAIAFECLQSVPKLNIVVEVTSESSEVLLRSERFDAIPALGEGALGPGMYRTLCTFPADLFGERHFSLSVYFLYHGVHHVGFQKVLGFDILFQGYHFSAESVSGRTRSYLRPRLEWKTFAEKG